MATSWVTIENGVKKQYTPTQEDLQDMEDACGRAAPLTKTITQGFFRGMASGIGFYGAQGAHSAMTHNNTASRSNLSDRGITLCKSHKVKQSDIDRMAAQVRETEQALAQAEIAKNQAIEATKAALAQILDHGTISAGVNGEGPYFNVDVNNPGTALVYDGPDFLSRKQAEMNASSEYNNYLSKLAQEKALLGQMQRSYAKDHKDDSSTGDIFISVGGGIVAFIVTLFSRNF